MSDIDREHSDTTTKAEDGQATADGIHNSNVEDDELPKAPKVGLLKKIQTKLDLDAPTLLLMFK